MRIEFVYERATTQLCLNPSLWAEYVDWARKINSPNLARIARRATRNCGWDAQLWVRRLKVMEHVDASPAEMERVLEEALVSLDATTLDGYLQVWWQFVLFHKRRVQSAPSDDAKTLFRAAVKRATNHTKLTQGNLPEQEHGTNHWYEQFVPKSSQF